MARFRCWAAWRWECDEYASPAAAGHRRLLAAGVIHAIQSIFLMPKKTSRYGSGSEPNSTLCVGTDFPIRAEPTHRMPRLQSIHARTLFHTLSALHTCNPDASGLFWQETRHLSLPFRVVAAQRPRPKAQRPKALFSAISIYSLAARRPRARILASFRKNPMFCTICKNRSWHPSGKHQ